VQYSGAVPSPQTSHFGAPAGSSRLLLLLVLLAGSLALSLCATALFSQGEAHVSLYKLSNLVGPTTESFLHGGGLTTCTVDMGTPGNPICFHAGRMPLASMVVALGIRLLGNHFLAVSLFKTVLLLLPIEIAIYLVWLRLPVSRARQSLAVLLLVLPFGMTAFLADVVNLQVEEGYSYSFLALAVALLFFAVGRSGTPPLGQGLLFALAVDGVYLAKSSMAPAAAVLLLGYLMLERHRTSRWLVFLLVLAAPIGWALHQHHVSGRYSAGTSIDGINLHKANNPEFLAHYPPPPNDSLDRYDADLNRGMHFTDEWSFNDFHTHAALAYLLTHPLATLRGDERKLDMIFFSLRKSGSSERHGLMLRLETVGFALFRLILWAALLGSLYALVRPADASATAGASRSREGPSIKTCSMLFLALVAASALPYVVGFAFTRHASILIYPSVLMCCRMLRRDSLSDRHHHADSAAASGLPCSARVSA
jgi:hypothetical protein